MPERIAVAIDFSPESERALKEAISLARAIGAEVHMVHVSGRLDLDDDSEGVRRLEEEVRKEVREKLAQLHARFDGQGAPLAQVLVEGFVAEGLCQVAAELDCQTIAVGTHGRSGLRRFFLGSVAEKVARVAKRDVLVSRGSRPMRGYQRIMVPTDFSPSAERALSRAVELAAPDAEIDLVNVWQLPGAITTHYAPVGDHTAAVRRITARIRSEAQEQAAPLLDRYRRDGVGIDFTAVNGSPGPAIIDRAAGCDLIVMGTHGRRGLSRWALGSVAERTIRHAPCSVLVTHATSDDEVNE